MSAVAVKVTVAIVVTLTALLVSVTHISNLTSTTQRSVENDHNDIIIETEATTVPTVVSTNQSVMNAAAYTKTASGVATSGRHVLNAAQTSAVSGLASAKSRDFGQDEEGMEEDVTEYDAPASPTNFVLHDCFPGKLCLLYTSDAADDC